MLTNDELATAIKAAVLAVSLVSPFDLAGKEATVKHLERLQQVQAERAAASSDKRPPRVPVGFVSFPPGSDGCDPVILRADRGEWDRLKTDPRCVREGVPVYLDAPEKQ